MGDNEKQLPGFIMCVCTGKCPGFSKMDIWDFINQVRVELPVEYGFIHPQLCEEDGDRFLADFLQAHRKVIIGGCAPNMQKKLFRDAFAAAGLDIKKDLIPSVYLMTPRGSVWSQWSSPSRDDGLMQKNYASI